MKKIITGFHSIEEILKSKKISQENGKDISIEIFFSKVGPRVKKILKLAKELSVEITEKKNAYLDKLTEALPQQLKDHRGIVLILDTKGKPLTTSFEEFIAKINDKQKAFIAILDSITDPHNIGSIVRSADQFGIDGIIIPENKSAGNFEMITKISAGATAWVPLISTTNLVRAVTKLKENGFWIYGADAGGEPLAKFQFPEKTALVMGNEGSGISRLLKESCDKIISIPTVGKLDSLNVSVATGILFYEISKNRIGEGV